jgi:nitrous oxidase accessory protein NosD
MNRLLPFLNRRAAPLALATIAAAALLAAGGMTAQTDRLAGQLVKAPGSSAVYYVHRDGTRRVFPDAQTYASWFPDFRGVKTVGAAELAARPLSGVVTYRPGARLVKIATDPRVYAVTRAGALRWVTTESAARQLFGADWTKLVSDVPDAYFVNYRLDRPVADDYAAADELAASPDIGSVIDRQAQPAALPPPAPAAAPNGAALPAAALFVAPSGDDAGGDGSSAHPYRTLHAALAAAPAGSTIALAPGTYTGEHRIRTPNLTITSVGPARAVLTAPIDGEDVTVRFDAEADGGTLRNVEVVGGFYAVAVETRWDWGEADRSGAAHVTVEDCVIRDTGYDGIKIKPGADHAVIRRNEIFNTGLRQAPGDCNAEGIDNVNGDDLLVEGNRIHDICSTGVYCKGGTRGCRIIGNRIENVGEAGILVGFDTSPEYFDLAENPGYYENLGGVVRGNLIRNAGGAGIGLYASRDALVENNTVVGAAGKYHAALYFGVTFQDWEPSAARPANVNPTIRDNVFVQPPGAGRDLVAVRYADELGGLSGLAGNPGLSGNCYFAADGAASFADARPPNGDDGFTGGLAAWQRRTQSDAGSVEADPLLDRDYRATAAACLGKGW